VFVVKQMMDNEVKKMMQKFRRIYSVLHSFILHATSRAHISIILGYTPTTLAMGDVITTKGRRRPRLDFSKAPYAVHIAHRSIRCFYPRSLFRIWPEFQ